MSELDFQKIFASGASSQIDWTDDNYLKGWGYLGNVPPSYQSFDSLQRLNDLKFKYLYDEFMGIETNTEELISNHNENSEAHKTLFDKKLDKNGGTVTGNLNASGYNITATKFIGNLQGKADSATNADSATKASQDSQGQVINTTYIKSITASNATLTVTKGNGTTSTVTINNVANASNLGTANVGSANKPIYLNAGTATACNTDLSTLAPKASPGLTGTPTAPTPDTDDDSTKIATTAFIQNLLASKFTSLKEENGWEISSDGVITMWGTGTITSNNTGHTGSVKAILPITISKMLICVGNMGTTVNNGVGSIMEVRLSSDGSYITGAWDSFSYSNSPTKWRYLLKGVV